MIRNYLPFCLFLTLVKFLSLESLNEAKGWRADGIASVDISISLVSILLRQVQDAVCKVGSVVELIDLKFKEALKGFRRRLGQNQMIEVFCRRVVLVEEVDEPSGGSRWRKRQGGEIKDAA